MQSMLGSVHYEYSNISFTFNWKHEDDFACSNDTVPDTFRLD